MGEWDNTVFVFTSDNGASREGHDRGSTQYFRRFTPTSSEVTEADLRALDEDRIGGPTTWPHYPRGWAMACNTPFRLYKITTYRGGHQVPFILSWPKRFGGAGGGIRGQYCHVTDVLPTLADLIGLEIPRERHGRAAAELSGASFADTAEDASAPSRHTEQYYECNGNRGYYRDGWEAVTCREVRSPSACAPDRDDLVPLSQDKWQLFNVEQDPTQCRDLAEEHPEILEELKTAWDEAAWSNQVYPLNEGAGLNHLRRPPADDVLSRQVVLLPGTPTLERYRSIQLIAGRSFTVTVDAEFGPDAEGILLAHGGQESGYLLYVRDGTLRFEENHCGEMVRMAPVPVPPGRATVTLRVELPARGTWLVGLDIDGTQHARGTFPQIIGMVPFEGIDVGCDRRSPVSWELYSEKGSYPYTGRIHKVTYTSDKRTAEALAGLIEQARQAGLALE